MRTIIIEGIGILEFPGMTLRITDNYIVIGQILNGNTIESGKIIEKPIADKKLCKPLRHELLKRFSDPNHSLNIDEAHDEISKKIPLLKIEGFVEEIESILVSNEIVRSGYYAKCPTHLVGVANQLGMLNSSNHIIPGNWRELKVLYQLSRE